MVQTSGLIFTICHFEILQLLITIIGMLRWKSNLTTSAAEMYKRRQGERINYRKLIYGKGLSETFLFQNMGSLGVLGS